MIRRQPNAQLPPIWIAIVSQQTKPKVCIGTESRISLIVKDWMLAVIPFHTTTARRMGGGEGTCLHLGTYVITSVIHEDSLPPGISPCEAR